eukprot:TRINITY_DN10166_c0_g1_i2.p1 TRINITY_DN10166_c0_g1~~TRINITY_DN10166_c0_g1_i2.p1  ORF type:complete len:221 (-),score=65.17 TRINITY_DN10166_c0_g1_i2:79-717(-)
MRRFFGRAKTAPPPSETINKLKDTLILLEKRETYLMAKIDQELQKAKLNATKNRKAALMALKRKKLYESQVEKLSQAQFTLETQIAAIENASANFAVLDTMRSGAAALSRLSRGMDIDDVEDTMDNIREQMDIANEVGEAISRPLDGMGIEEEDLQKELEDLEQEELDSQLLSITAKNEPAKTVTNARVAQPVKPLDEDEDLKALEQEMAFN